jgi:hypothetical protein
MKTITKIALVMGFASFAFFANASLPGVNVNPTHAAVTPGIDSTVVDFVTVGATMPYRTGSAAGNFAAWRANVEGAFGTSTLSPLPSFALQWYVDGAPLSGATTDSVNLTWNTIGQFKLTAKTTILLGGNNVGCEDAISGKTIYVLPEPVVTLRATSNGHQIVLGCTATTHQVRFVTHGIGQRSITYTVYRQPLTGSGNTDAQLTSALAGTSQGNASWFTDATPFNAAEDLYSSANAFIDLNITGLEPGFVYTVEITGVSDQISRKSKVGDNNDGFVTPPARVFAAFAVLPEPTSTKIEHTTNLGH